MRTFLAVLLLTLPSFAQTPDPHSVPVIDAALGPCTADFTITGPDAKPVYNAKIRVRIAYGFLSAHKLDLEVGTNVDGKARFTGLPDRLKHGLFFEASEGDRTGSAFDDPSQTCKAQFPITIRRPPQTTQ
jgi:hypothetical protein